MVKGKLPLLVSGIILFATLARAQDQVDLSVGSAIPSNNGSIRENPAGLALFQSKIFDLSTLFNTGTSPNFEGSLSSGMGTFGYGLEIERVPNDFALTAGFGAQTGTFSIGVNANFFFSNFAPTFNLGIIQTFQAVSLAIVLRDLSNAGKNWTVSFGFNPGKNLRIGCDFDFQSTMPIFGVYSATAVTIAELYSTQKFAFRVSYGFSFIPTLVTGSPGFGAGLIFWPAKKTSFYSVYQDYVTNMTYTFGMKFLL